MQYFSNIWFPSPKNNILTLKTTTAKMFLFQSHLRISFVFEKRPINNKKNQQQDTRTTQMNSRTKVLLGWGYNYDVMNSTQKNVVQQTYVPNNLAWKDFYLTEPVPNAEEKTNEQ